MLCSIAGLVSNKIKVNVFYQELSIIINLMFNNLYKSSKRTVLLKLSASYGCLIYALFVIPQVPCTCASWIMPSTSKHNLSSLSYVVESREPKYGERLFPLQRNKKENEKTQFGIVFRNTVPKINVENNQSNNEKERDRQLLQPKLSETDIFHRDEEFFTVKTSHLINVSSTNGMSTEYFVVPAYSRLKPTTSLIDLSSVTAKASSAPISRIERQNDSNDFKQFPFSKGNLADHDYKLVRMNYTRLNGSSLRDEPWVIPVLVLAALTMLIMTAFEIFILIKAWRTSPSRRHLFLGQMLLLGLFACASLAVVITTQPSTFSCGILRFGVGVAYALVFASLLVKCVFLISLNGGVYLPAPYQSLLLLFAVLIQVAIGTQWLLTQPPDVILHVTANLLGSESSKKSSAHTNNHISALGLLGKTSDKRFSDINNSSTEETIITNRNNSTLVAVCKFQFLQLIFSMTYIICLIIFVAGLATKSRGIRDNYREATYIGLAIISSIPIWIGWMLCGMAVADRNKDACVALGLIANSFSMFFVMFIPKSRQLAAIGKEGPYVNDYFGRLGSGYSSSFFHFKPIKYGIMSGGSFIVSADLSVNNTNSTNQHANGQICNVNEGLLHQRNENRLNTTLESTLSNNPNVYFQRGAAVHSDMMY